MDEGRVLDCALLAAQVFLESGAETYRAEDSATRICAGFGLEDVQVYALPTGIFLSLAQEKGEPLNRMRRLRKRSTNLENIDRANQISRELAAGRMTVDEGVERFRDVLEQSGGKKWRAIAAASLSAGFFTVLFGGKVIEFFVSMLCGATVQYMVASFKREDYFQFITSLVGGAVCALYALVFSMIIPRCDADAIIVGAIMPLLPGLVMTNAIRDTMRGDLVSGVARVAEALFVAIALAAGAGLVLGARALFVLRGVGI